MSGKSTAVPYRQQMHREVPCLLETSPFAFRVTVRHKEDLVPGIPYRLQSEDIVLPIVVQNAGELAMPLAWLDSGAMLPAPQKTADN
ncbi:MAG: hypothetical protein J3Q66DRAFT_436351 [Benniella sp.]|nr:MAG: hypothetical protein J3Q66DRAFT_436351 [Benniella sp.]